MPGYFLRLYCVIAFSLGSSLAHAHDFNTRITASDEKFLRVQVDGQMQIVFSKAKFTKVEDAREFCADNYLKFDIEGITSILGLVMTSTQAVTDAFSPLVSFKFEKGEKKATGVWAWNGENGDIAMIYDGHGIEPVIENSKALNSVLLKNGYDAIEIPAICLDENVKF